jgi:hypothetical protein
MGIEWPANGINLAVNSMAPAKKCGRIFSGQPLRLSKEVMMRKVRKSAGSFVLMILLPLGLLMAGCGSATTLPSPTVAGQEVEATAVPPSPVPAEEASLWEVVVQTEIQPTMRMAAFLDENLGLAGGPSDPGKAHYTADGGQTWGVAESSLG